MNSQIPGLQPERTDLSWTRTSLAFLVNGALLLLRDELAVPDLMHRTTVAIALALALFTAFMSYRRRKVLARRPLPVPLAAETPLLWLGIGTAAFGLVVLLLAWTG